MINNVDARPTCAMLTRPRRRPILLVTRYLRLFRINIVDDATFAMLIIILSLTV